MKTLFLGSVLLLAFSASAAEITLNCKYSASRRSANHIAEVRLRGNVDLNSQKLAPQSFFLKHLKADFDRDVYATGIFYDDRFEPRTHLESFSREGSGYSVKVNKKTLETQASFYEIHGDKHYVLTCLPQ